MLLLNEVNAYGIYSLSNSKWITKYNINKKTYPASITKLLTALITLEHFNTNKYLKITHIPKTPRYRADLILGNKYTVHLLLEALLIRSMNDIALLLAKKVEYKTKTKWCDLTAKLCAKYKMNSSQFINPVGLHNVNHYTTINDLILLGKEVYKNEIIMNILKMPTLKILYQENRNPVIFNNSNILLNKNGVIAGKTGFTPKAGKCFLFFFEKNNESYIAAFTGAKKANFEKTINSIINSVEKKEDKLVT